MWQQRIHQYLVNAFLRSPRFHRIVRLLDREGYDETRFPDIAEINRLHRMEKEVKKRKRKAFLKLFREELGYEFNPFKRRNH